MKKRRKEKDNLKDKIFRYRNIISIICLIVLSVFFILFYKMGFIPFTYSLIITFIFLFIYIFGFIFINFKNKIFNIIGYLLLLILFICSCFGTYYIYNTDRFLNSSFGNNIITTTNTYYVVCLKSNNYTKNDITGTVSYYLNGNNTKKANENLSSNYLVDFKGYSNITEMFSDLNSNTIKFMLLEKNYYDLVFELDIDLNKDNYVILDKINIKSTKKSSNEIKDSFNVYVGGTDFTNTTMDFNMIISVNMNTNKIIMTSIPRDYYIPVYGKNGRDTLSYMGPYGIDTSVKSLEEFFDINIDYYVKVNTDSLVEVVDEVGGITFCSDYEFTSTHALVKDTYDNSKGKKLYVKKGCYQYNGIETLTIARERNAFPGRDRVRQENCRKILIAIFNELNNTNTLKNYTSILDSFSGLYETNIPRVVVNTFVQTTLNNKGKWEIIEQKVDGVDTKDYVHLTNYKDWVMYPSSEDVKKASEKINNVVKDN